MQIRLPISLFRSRLVNHLASTSDYLKQICHNTINGLRIFWETCLLVTKYLRSHTETNISVFCFRFGAIVILLFVLTSAFSYVIGSCKRRQQNLIRIRNISTRASVPVISTISGPGGIIQPRVNYKKPHSSSVQATAIISKWVIYLVPWLPKQQKLWPWWWGNMFLQCRLTFNGLC